MIKRQQVKMNQNGGTKNMQLHLLLLEIDYELAGLSYAIRHDDQREINELKNRLNQLTVELQIAERCH